MGYMVAYFGKELDSADVKAIAALKPKVAAFYDEAFGSDSAKINAVENLEKAGISVLVI